MLLSSQERPFPAVGYPGSSAPSPCVFITHLELRVPEGQSILLNIACNWKGNFISGLNYWTSIQYQGGEQGGRAGKAGYNPIFTSSPMKAFLVSPLPHFSFLCHYFVKSLSDQSPWFKSLLSRMFENNCGVFIFFKIMGSKIAF